MGLLECSLTHRVRIRAEGRSGLLDPSPRFASGVPGSHLSRFLPNSAGSLFPTRDPGPHAAALNGACAAVAVAAAAAASATAWLVFADQDLSPNVEDASRPNPRCAGPEGDGFDHCESHPAGNPLEGARKSLTGMVLETCIEVFSDDMGLDPEQRAAKRVGFIRSSVLPYEEDPASPQPSACDAQLFRLWRVTAERAGNSSSVPHSEGAVEGTQPSSSPDSALALTNREWKRELDGPVSEACIPELFTSATLRDMYCTPGSESYLKPKYRLFPVRPVEGLILEYVLTHASQEMQEASPLSQPTSLIGLEVGVGFGVSGASMLRGLSASAEARGIRSVEYYGIDPHQHVRKRSGSKILHDVASEIGQQASRGESGEGVEIALTMIHASSHEALPLLAYGHKADTKSMPRPAVAVAAAAMLPLSDAQGNPLSQARTDQQMVKHGHLCRQCDAIVIDGGHRFHDVIVDAYFADLLLRDGGIVAFDDAQHDSVQDGLAYVASHFMHWRLLGNAHNNVVYFQKVTSDHKEKSRLLGRPRHKRNGVFAVKGE